MSKIFVAGHKGMVGSAILRRLEQDGQYDIIVRSKEELNLLDQTKVKMFLKQEKPDYIFIAAAKVGGIHSNNTFRTEFLYENLTIQNNIIHSAFEADVQRLCFLASSCIYPRDCKQPIKEEYLLTGPLEKTNEPYAIAKIAGLKLCEALNAQYKTQYLTLMPTNLYGPNDSYDLLNCHFLPALLRKAHTAKKSGINQLEVWGSGKPRREMLYVDDLADACVYFMKQKTQEQILNVGTGKDHTVQQIAELVKEIVGLQGEVIYDSSKPDGTPRKLLDVSRVKKYRWTHSVDLHDGIKKTYEDFLKHGRSK